MTLRDLIRAALQEDMPTGDLTTDLLGVGPKPGKARLLAKQDLSLSGRAVFEQVIALMEPNAQMTWHFDDGQRVLKGQIICTLQGDLIQLLKAERTALNFIMHLSGIATLTHEFAKEVQHTSTRILDTRKTTPGYRDLEKRAVVHGGGYNHRHSLSAAILLKDNHLKVMGGIKLAVERVRANSAGKLPIEVEAGSLEEVKEAVGLGVHRILLDNMDNETLKQAVALIPKGIETEASGNMSLARVRSVAEIGVNFISVGALTHSAPSADISLKFDWI